MKTLKRFTALWITMLMAALGLHAQDLRGTIRGTVRDATGATVPGSQVRVTNTATNTTTKVVTTDAGYYNVEYLAPGTYRVDVSREGFKTISRQGIELQTRQTLSLDLTMEVGSVSDAVTVTGEVPLIETATATAGRTLEARRLMDLPLLGGQVAMSVLMAPGVVNDQTYYLPNAADRNGYAARVGGVGFANNEYSLDGFSTAIAMNRLAFQPPVYAIQEMRVETNSFDATIGGAQGGFFSAPTKSGSNAYHGNIWDHHRQNRWNALNWNTIYNYNLQVASGTAGPRSSLMGSGRFNDFGFTLGGPVTLPYWNEGPKLLKTKDKLFFFFSGNGQASRSAGGAAYRMPTELERTGDFSEILARAGSDYQLYDPLSGRNAGGIVTRSVFPGNKIPDTRISPIAKWYSQWYPLPNSLGEKDFNKNYFNSRVAGGNDTYSYMARADYRLNDRHNTFVRWFYSPYDEMASDFSGSGRFTSPGFKRNNGWLVSHVYTLGAGTVLNLQGGWSNNKTGNRSTPAEDPTIAGLPSYIREAAGDRLALFAITFGGTNPVASFETGPASYTTYSTWATQATLSQTRGAHTFRGGYEYRRFRYYDDRPGRPAGGASFDGNLMKANPNASNKGSALQYAQFLLGLPSGGSIDQNPVYDYRDSVHSMYFQEDWRATRRLTLNAGVRYELPLPVRVAGNRNTRGFDPTLRTPISDAAEAAYAKSPLPELPASMFKVNGAVTWLGVNGVPTTIYNADKNNISPRFGLAYKLTERTVLRAGYGIFYENSIGTQSSENFPRYWNQTTAISLTPDYGLSFPATLADPFPAINNGKRFLDPQGNSLGAAASLGNGYTYFSENRKVAPYIHRAHFEIQNNFWKDWVGQIGWTTGWLRDQGIDRNINELPQQYWAVSTTRAQSVQDDLTRLVPNPFFGLVPLNTTLNKATTIAKNLLLRPFPQFNGSLTERNNLLVGGRYDEVTASIDKRYAAGVAFGINFTGSKTYSEKIYQNFETTPTRILGDWTHRFVGNFTYEIPYGKGRRWGSSAALPLRLLIGGWQVSGLYQYQLRGPLKLGKHFFTGDYSSLKLPEGVSNWMRMFNTDAGFVRDSKKTPVGYQVWVNPEIPDPSIPNGQALNNWDTSMSKGFYFNEQRFIRFKFEMYNALNHQTFVGPDTDPTSTRFGMAGGKNPPGTNGMPRTLQLSLQIFF